MKNSKQKQCKKRETKEKQKKERHLGFDVSKTGIGENARKPQRPQLATHRGGKLKAAKVRNIGRARALGSATSSVFRPCLSLVGMMGGLVARMVSDFGIGLSRIWHGCRVAERAWHANERTVGQRIERRQPSNADRHRYSIGASRLVAGAARHGSDWSARSAAAGTVISFTVGARALSFTHLGITHGRGGHLVSALSRKNARKNRPIRVGGVARPTQGALCFSTRASTTRVLGSCESGRENNRYRNIAGTSF